MKFIHRPADNGHARRLTISHKNFSSVARLCVYFDRESGYACPEASGPIAFVSFDMWGNFITVKCTRSRARDEKTIKPYTIAALASVFLEC